MSTWTTPNLTGGTWFSASRGCRIRCYRTEDGDVNVVVGETPHMHELTFDEASFRDLITKGSAVLAGIDIRARETAHHSEPEVAEPTPDNE